MSDRFALRIPSYVGARLCFRSLVRASAPSRPAVSFRCAVAILLAMVLSVPPAHAFQAPLSDESIREAYFLGQRNDETTRDFFLSYVRTFDRPRVGPYVSEVEIYTPFGQLVELASRRNNYSAQQAASDYRHTVDSIFVRVRIQFTATYGTARYLAALPEDRSLPQPQIANFDRDFKIGLRQNDQWIEPIQVDHHLTNTAPTRHFAFDPDGVGALVETWGIGYGTNGWLVWLQFDPAAIDSDTAFVEILGPDDQRWKASFDFGRLR